MKSVSLANSPDRVECVTNSPLSTGLLALKLDVPMACGGNGRCATCHILVLDGAANLTPIEDRERRTLGLLSQCAPNSRLACQAHVLGDVTVKIPDADFISAFDELERMIGKRASKDILHATDGRLLVARGQVVTRYVVNKLKSAGGF